MEEFGSDVRGIYDILCEDHQRNETHMRDRWLENGFLMISLPIVLHGK